MYNKNKIYHRLCNDGRTKFNGKNLMYEVTSSSDANKILDIKIQRTHHVPIIVFIKKMRYRGRHQVDLYIYIHNSFTYVCTEPANCRDWV